MTQTTRPFCDVLTCGGRPFLRGGDHKVLVDPDGYEVFGDPCGRTAHGHSRGCYICNTLDETARERLLDQVIQRARATGWKIGPRRPDGTYDTMCPTCGKPDRRASLDATCRSLAKKFPPRY